MGQTMSVNDPLGDVTSYADVTGTPYNTSHEETSRTTAASDITSNETGLSGESNPHILPLTAQLFYVIAFVPMIIVATGGNVIVIWIVTVR